MNVDDTDDDVEVSVVVLETVVVDTVLVVVEVVVVEVMVVELSVRVVAVAVRVDIDDVLVVTDVAVSVVDETVDNVDVHKPHLPSHSSAILVSTRTCNYSINHSPGQYSATPGMAQSLSRQKDRSGTPLQ